MNLPSRTQERINAILVRIRTELVSTLLVEYALRLSPATLQKLEALLRQGLEAARLIGQLHAARPPDPPEPDNLELADTRPLKTRPPPPPKGKC